MIKNWLILPILALLTLPAMAQGELKLYGAFLEYPGISYEQTIKENLSVEAGGSFFTQKKGTWHGLQIRHNNLFVHGMVKKYIPFESGRTSFFYGAYARYWRTNHFAEDAEKEPLPTSIQIILSDDQRVTHTTQTNKISLGALAGFKWLLGDHFTAGINTGIGFSPPFAYWQKEFSYNEPPRTSEVGPTAWYGYVNHLSLLGQVCVGYRFGE